MSIVSITIEQIIILAILVLLGVFISRIKLIDEHINKGMSEILLHIVTPCLIISNLQAESSKVQVKGILIVFGVSFLIYTINAILVRFIYKENYKYDYKVARFMSMYANCGYMGVPLVQGILGDRGVFYTVAVIAVFNFFAFTHGVVLMKKDNEKLSLKGLISPALISVFAGMIMLVCQIKLPQIILSPISMMSKLNTPLAMLVAGYNIYKTDFKHLTNKLRMFEIISVKNLIIPIIVTIALSFTSIDMIQKLVIIITSACSSATVGVIFSVKYERDSEFAATTFALSTIFILGTLPVVVSIANLLGMYL